VALQYEARRDRQGWTVFDRWTGKTVVLDHALRSGLSWLDAEALIDWLNRRGQQGHRGILQ
jgi:hypothetical protein